jgi:AraC-like DNA-binding protein
MDDGARRAEWLDLISPHVSHTGHRTFPRGVINPVRIIYDHELFMFSAGRSLLVFGEEEYPCPKDTFLIIPPGREHISYALTDQIHIHWTHFDWRRVRRPVRERRVHYGGRPVDPRRVRGVPRYVPKGVLHGTIESPMYVFDLHIRLCEAWASGDPRRRRSARGLLLGVLSELLAPAGEARGSEDRATGLAERARNRLTELANRPFSEMPSVKESLRAVGASYFHLERVFKRHYGLAPSAYVAALRVERIKTLLRDTRMPVAQIARTLGFDDPGYLSRFFSKHVGCSPRAFRRRST